MTEAEILYQIQEILNRLVPLTQWWASISFGLILVAHLASEKLNLFLLSIIVALYSAFTAWIGQVVFLNSSYIKSLGLDLNELISSGEATSNFTRNMVSNFNENSGVNPAQIIAFAGTYLGCISYLIYNYVKHRSKN